LSLVIQSNFCAWSLWEHLRQWDRFSIVQALAVVQVSNFVREFQGKLMRCNCS